MLSTEILNDVVNEGMKPLKVTIEDPNDGETRTFETYFIAGAFLSGEDGGENGQVGVKSLCTGYANTLEQVALLKSLKDWTIPKMLEQLEDDLFQLPEEQKDALLSILLAGEIREAED